MCLPPSATQPVPQIGAQFLFSILPILQTFQVDDTCARTHTLLPPSIWHALDLRDKIRSLGTSERWLFCFVTSVLQSHSWLTTPACTGKGSGNDVPTLHTPFRVLPCLNRLDHSPGLASFAGCTKMASVGFPQTARDALAPAGLAFFLQGHTQP